MSHYSPSHRYLKQPHSLAFSCPYPYQLRSHNVVNLLLFRIVFHLAPVAAFLCWSPFLYLTSVCLAEHCTLFPLLSIPALIPFFFHSSSIRCFCNSRSLHFLLHFLVHDKNILIGAERSIPGSWRGCSCSIAIYICYFSIFVYFQPSSPRL